MGVRRARLGVEVVTVVPDRHQPEVVHRCERGRARADHDPARAAGDGEELAVAPGGARVRPSARRGARRPARSVRAASSRATSRRSGTHQDAAAPARERGRRRRRRAAAASPPRAAPTRPPGASHRPPGGPGTPRPPGRRAQAPRRGVRVDGDRLLGRRRLLLRGRVARRDREPEHVGAGAGVALGEQPRELGDRRAQHRLGADHPPQRRERAGVVGVGAARDDVAVEVLAGEAHLDPGAGHRRRRPSRPARRSRTGGRGGPAGSRRARARRVGRDRVSTAGRRGAAVGSPAVSAGTARHRLLQPAAVASRRRSPRSATRLFYQSPRPSTGSPRAVAGERVTRRDPAPARSALPVTRAGSASIRCPSAYRP